MDPELLAMISRASKGKKSKAKAAPAKASTKPDQTSNAKQT